MAQAVGVPTVGGVTDSVKDYAVGAVGGIGYALASQIFGSGLIGGAVAAGLTGATIKGQRGATLATILGFMGIMGGFGASQVEADAGPGVM